MLTRTNFCYTLFFSLFILLPNSAKSEDKGAWFSAGFGPSLVYQNSTKPINYLSGFAQFSKIKKNNVFSIFINKIGRINTIKPTNNLASKEFDNSTNLGLMLGKTKAGRYGYFSTCIGLSYTKGTSIQFNTAPTFLSKKDFHTIGIPIEIQIGTPIKFFGLGITLFTNLNKESSFSCLMLTLYYGKLL